MKHICKNLYRNREFVIFLLIIALFPMVAFAATNFKILSIDRVLNGNLAIGDIFYHAGDPDGEARLPIGTTGQVLTSDGTKPTWGTSSFDISTKVQQSIVYDGVAEKINLSGDSATPGNSKFYATNPTGTRGFYDFATVLPSGPYIAKGGTTVLSSPVVCELNNGTAEPSVFSVSNTNPGATAARMDFVYSGGNRGIMKYTYAGWYFSGAAILANITTYNSSSYFMARVAGSSASPDSNQYLSKGAFMRLECYLNGDGSTRRWLVGKEAHEDAKFIGQFNNDIYSTGHAVTPQRTVFEADGFNSTWNVNGKYLNNGQPALSIPAIGSTYNNIILGNGGTTLAHASASEGWYNTIAGYDSASAMTTGYYNCLFGSGAGRAITSGYSNILAGVSAGDTATTGFENVVIGHEADVAANSSSAVIAIGPSSTGRYQSVSVGHSTKGGYGQNVVMGHYAGNSMSLLDTLATRNVFLGYEAGRYAVSNAVNNMKHVAIGYDAGKYLHGQGNVVIGHEALMGSSSTGDACEFNTAIGTSSLRSLTTGANNTAIGYLSGTALTTGDKNVGVGVNTNFSNTTGTNNTAIGYGALTSNTSSNNTAVGYNAGLYTTGAHNTYVGSECATAASQTGDYNCGLGLGALRTLTSGAGNTAIGYEAGNNITTGTYNTILGYGTTVLTDGVTNSTILGNGAVGYGSNTVTVGNTSVTDNYFSGNTRSGKFVHTQLTGALTDDTPTDAQIDGITGSTPSGVGAGWMATIKDSDGSGKLYKIESDGTDWYYIAMTKAL
jgi:hypothetical protein